MILLRSVLLVLLGVQLRTQPPAPLSGPHTVIVLIKDIEPKHGGELLVALMDKAGKQVLSKRVPVSGPQARITFYPVETGTYAVRYFHDANTNGKLDTGWFNIPDEGVGCSNDAKGFMSAPDFADMLFPVESSTAIESHIHYY